MSETEQIGMRSEGEQIEGLKRIQTYLWDTRQLNSTIVIRTGDVPHLIAGYPSLQKAAQIVYAAHGYDGWLSDSELEKTDMAADQAGEWLADWVERNVPVSKRVGVRG